MRQSKIGAEGLAFQGMRIDHTEQIALGDRLSVARRRGISARRNRFFGFGAASARSAGRESGSGLDGFLLVAANPPSAAMGTTGALESAIDELDSLPAVLFHDGRPVLEGGWHQEFSVKHKLTNRSQFEVAAFHDSARHQAIFGSGPAASPDFVQDAFSRAFLYDGGNRSSWGTRVAYRQKISDNLEFAAVYAWAGALSPIGELDTTSADLRR